MEIINNPTQDEIRKAAKALKDGHLVAFPTETVYGLGADATNEKAVSRIYSVKARPTNHPLIVHISSINQLSKWAVEIPGYAIKLADEFWPGPMTLILKRSKIVEDFITGGQENVGVRVPSHPVALALLREFEKLGGLGVAAPSANKFGAVSPTNSQDVYKDIGNNLFPNDLILNGGSCAIGIESTIVNCTLRLPNLLRPGSITSDMIKNLTKISSQSSNIKKIRVPGVFSSHYSPAAEVVISEKALVGDGFLALANIITPSGAIRLLAPTSLEDYAKDLYVAFRSADEKRLKRIVVVLPEGGGLAEAIRDRIIKASGYSIK
jgi:L-threonylcarbamoyladenylate synthase